MGLKETKDRCEIRITFGDFEADQPVFCVVYESLRGKRIAKLDTRVAKNIYATLAKYCGRSAEGLHSLLITAWAPGIDALYVVDDIVEEEGIIMRFFNQGGISG